MIHKRYFFMVAYLHQIQYRIHGITFFVWLIKINKEKTVVKIEELTEYLKIKIIRICLDISFIISNTYINLFFVYARARVFNYCSCCRCCCWFLILKLFCLCHNHPICILFVSFIVPKIKPYNLLCLLFRFDSLCVRMKKKT